MRMGCILTGLLEFALQILLGDFHIPQGHVDVNTKAPEEKRKVKEKGY
jgi:hypothetical protein